MNLVYDPVTGDFDVHENQTETGNYVEVSTTNENDISLRAEDNGLLVDADETLSENDNESMIFTLKDSSNMTINSVEVPITFDETPPLLTGITQSSDATTIKLNITEANDLYAISEGILAQKINTNQDVSDIIGMSQGSENIVESVVVDQDLSSGGTVTITLKDASSGAYDGETIYIYLSEFVDNVNNELTNNSMQDGLELMIEADGDTWDAQIIVTAG